MEEKVTVLFVCLGNICRSPTAEAVFRHKLVERGLEERVEIDSAGTGDWHIGHAPDERAQDAARKRGYDLSALRGRQIGRKDCGRYDYLLVMDGDNLAAVQALCPEAEARRLLDFAPDRGVRDVPDPYYGGERGFDEVLDLIEEACDGLLDEIEERLQARA